MCIRDRIWGVGRVELAAADQMIHHARDVVVVYAGPKVTRCLLYTSDAADDLLCVDLGGRRIIKKKKHNWI